MSVYSYNSRKSIQDAYGRNLDKNVEYKRFSEDYFSGQDTRIYFGDIWVDEITGLQFSLQENVAPIFGYASYTYDTVAKGSRQIQGSFRINFKESYYLHYITNRLESKLAGSLENVEGTGKARATQPVSVDHLVSKFTDGKAFEDLADQFELAMWGGSDNVAYKNRANQQGSGSYFTGSRPTLAKNGFNILVLYGPYTEGFKDGKPAPVAGTAHSLTGVHLTGVNQIVDGSGQPIMEEYSFIARDLDANVNMYDADITYPFAKDGSAPSGKKPTRNSQGYMED